MFESVNAQTEHGRRLESHTISSPTAQVSLKACDPNLGKYGETTDIDKENTDIYNFH